MPTCSICKNYSQKTKGTGIMYLSFPKDPSICNRWIEVCNRRIFNISAARICSIHFLDECFIGSFASRKKYGYPIRNSKVLKHDAVPTELLNAKIDEKSSSSVTTEPFKMEIEEIDEQEAKYLKLQADYNKLKEKCDNFVKRVLSLEATNKKLMTILKRYFSPGQVEFLLSQRKKPR